MCLLAVQKFSATAEDGDHGYPFERSVIFLSDVEVLVPFADVHVHYMVILIDQWLDIGLVEAVIESKAVEAPVRSENKKHALVILRGSLQRIGNLFVRIRIGWIQFAQPGRDSVLGQRRLLRDKLGTTHNDEE